MKISAVIPAYNEENHIGFCLEHLLGQEEKADEIIVVDNNSTDNTAKIARSYGVHVVEEKKQGMIHARNKGFNTARFEIIARTDADTILPSDWILKIKENFKNENIDALSGPAYFFKLPSFIQISHLPTLVFFRIVGKLLKHDSLYGPNMALRNSIWQKLKNEVCLTDSKAHEDIDLAMHLNRYGRIKFDESLRVYTSPRRWLHLTSDIEYGSRLIKTLSHTKNIKEYKIKIKA